MTLVKPKEGGKGFYLSINPKAIFSIVICILVATSGIYYAFFACFFLLIAGTASYFMGKRSPSLISAVILIVTITCTGLINISPTFIYQIKNGINSEVPNRHYGGTEKFALKIFQMFLPVTGHRVDLLADVKNIYNEKALMVNENDCATLGVIGFAGFIILIAFLLFYQRNILMEKERIKLLNHLSILNISAVLLATVGGFCSIISPLVAYRIRAYNRISVYIAFFSFIAILVLIEILYKKYLDEKYYIKLPIGKGYKRINLSKFFLNIFAILILLLGLFDQSSLYFIHKQDKYKSAYEHDKEFIQRIEKSIPENSMIFQLPYDSYPGTSTVHNMEHYDHFRCYLHSKTLRWSYGVIKGRKDDAWQKSIASKPVKEMIKILSKTGFNGIYLNRNGYIDNGMKIISEIKNVLKDRPIYSKNNQLLFFSMIDYNVSTQ
ncbi:MAG: hypothetical protein SVZ03_16880 [Spirochaetota bacterium]|nr:hypothetical protein [Spirochaetota bacterium]